ncbi:MAG: c-type cytochrome [SAR202 cluster bacterium]|nr:c-type cytochrome [SAR202 cluster bacterium]
MKFSLLTPTRVVLAALLLGLAALFSLPSAAPASAHANLIQSGPAPDSVLDSTPAGITLRFSEPIAPSFSSIEVLNAAGQRVDQRALRFDANDLTLMALDLPVLPNGTYTVVWRNLSTVDGHSVRGSFAFSIGEPLTPQEPVESEPGLFQSPASPPIRWLVLLSGMVMVGGLAFYTLVLSPFFSKNSTSPQIRKLGQSLKSQALKTSLLMALLFLAASAAQLLVQASTAADTTFLKAFGSPLRTALRDTEWGHLWLWRTGLGLALVLTLGCLSFKAFQSSDAKRESIRVYLETFGPYLALALGCASLFAISMASHSAALTDIKAAAVFTDYSHLLASAFWAGALVHLALALPLFFKSLNPSERQTALASLTPRFSIIATLSVGTLIITGLYSAWMHVGSFSAVDTPYAYTLIAKTVIILPLLAFGALNILWVRPRLKGNSAASLWLRRFVIGETVLVVLVALSVGFLTSLEPARQADESDGVSGAGIRLSDTVEGINVTLRVEPGQIGVNRASAELRDAGGTPVGNASQVEVTFAYLEADVGASTLTLSNQGRGIYVSDSAFLSLQGQWQAEVTVRRPDAFDTRTAFRFAVAAPGQAVGGAAPEEDIARLLLGIEIILMGALFVSVGIAVGGWFTGRGAVLVGPGVVAAIFGVSLMFNSGAFSDEEITTGPFPPNAESLAKGKALYQQHCIACHGVGGRGDGPAAGGLSPPPLDLTVHVPLHTAQELLGFIENGIPGTAMPAFDDVLSYEEKWHLINYIKSLAE